MKEDINSFLENYIIVFKKDMNADLLDKKEIKIDGRQAWVLSFKGGRQKGFFLKSYILPIRSDNCIYIFQAGTPIYMREKIEPILNAIATSFHVER